MLTLRTRLLVVTICVASIIGIGYAIAQTGVTFQNTSTINPGQNLLITNPSPLTLTCPAHGSTLYQKSWPNPVNWNLTAGGIAQHYFFCIDNTGPVNDVLTISSSPATAITSGSCPAPSSATLVYAGAAGPTNVPGNSATLTPEDVSVCAGGNATPGTGPTFQITVQ
jgi:hypothetical protein